jgi:hypothetical protein
VGQISVGGGQLVIQFNRLEVSSVLRSQCDWVAITVIVGTMVFAANQMQHWNIRLPRPKTFGIATGVHHDQLGESLCRTLGVV